MKKYALIGIVLFSTISLHAHPVVFDPTSRETSAIEQSTKPTLYASFYSLICNLSSLVVNPSMCGVKLVEETMTKAIQTAFQLMQTGADTLTIHKDGKLHVDIDLDVQEEMMEIIARQTTRVVVAQYSSDKQKQNAEEEEDQVLSKFAGIVGHFMQLIQRPNDPTNVVPNLLGMVGGIIEIGKEVLKRSNLNLYSEEQDIVQYVAQLDDTFKNNMLNIATTQSQ